MTKCKICGREKVPYTTDPDMVEDFCPVCDDIPGGAEPSAWPTFIAMITPKKEGEEKRRKEREAGYRKARLKYLQDMEKLTFPQEVELKQLTKEVEKDDDI